MEDILEVYARPYNRKFSADTDCWAHFIKEMLEERYADAEKVVLVKDNLNTHTTASLYTAFPPEDARCLADRLEIHHTPKHGSWLNREEVELSV